MSSTAIVTATSQHTSIRPFPASLSKSRLNQASQPHPLDRRTTYKTGSAINSNMSSTAAYYGQRAAPFETMASSRDSFNLAQVDRWSSTREPPNWQENYQAYSAQNSSQSRQQYQQQQIPLQTRQASSSTISRQPTRPSTPNSGHSSQTAGSGGTLTGDAQSMVLHSMQIPARISPKGGNLADFAAQVSKRTKPKPLRNICG